MIKEITYPCKIDNSDQPAMFFQASGNEPRPLLVALHTWSYDHTSGFEEFLRFVRKKNWHLIFPKFRGPNWTSEACGSEYVVSDIEDAVRFVKGNYPVDNDKVYLCGGSGGGYAALLMAGRRPDLWSAVSAWCPCADLVRWYQEGKVLGTEYPEHIATACGGSPELSEKAYAEALRRSATTWLVNAANCCTVDISTGIHDGHTGSVPVSQAVRCFNILAGESDRISEADMDFINKNEKIPAELLFHGEDPSFGERTIYLRRQSNRARLTLFEGGHEILFFPACQWLERQSRANGPDWSPVPEVMEPNGQTALSR